MNRRLIEAYVTASTIIGQKMVEAAIVTDPSPIFNDGVRYKLFNDLTFMEHPCTAALKIMPVELRGNDFIKEFYNATKASIEYKNGYGNSILFGSLFYSNGVDNYELAVTYNDGMDFSTPLTDDVVGYAPASVVELYMIATQRLEPKH
jgi:hypothetical protein